MDLVIDEEWLFIASKISPSDIIESRVRTNLDRNRFGLRSVMDEHLCDLRVGVIGGVWTDHEVLGEQELAYYEGACCVGQDIDGLESECAVASPFDGDLNRQVGGWLEDSSIRIEPIHSTSEDGWELCIEPEHLRHRQIDSRRNLIILVEDSVVVGIPVRAVRVIFLQMVPIAVGSLIVVVVLIDCIRTSEWVAWVCDP